MNENSNMNREIYVRYKIADQEFEGRGPIEDVNRHVMHWTSIVAPGTKDGVIQHRLPEVVDESTPLLVDSDVLKTDGLTQNGNSLEHYSDRSHLIPFYRKMPCKSQREQILVILYYYMVCLKQETVTMDDLNQAYNSLADIPVEKPANITARINEIIEEKPALIRRIGRGEYKLTLLGHETVKKWLAGEEDSSQ